MTAEIMQVPEFGYVPSGYPFRVWRVSALPHFRSGRASGRQIPGKAAKTRQKTKKGRAKARPKSNREVEITTEAVYLEYRITSNH